MLKPFLPFILTLQPLQFGDGVGCYSDALDGTLIATPADSEVAILAPVCAPAVLDNPVLLSGLVAAAIPNQQHGMVGQLEGIEGVCEACVVVDALLIVHEVRVDLWEDRGTLRLRIFCFSDKLRIKTQFLNHKTQPKL